MMKRDKEEWVDPFEKRTIRSNTNTKRGLRVKEKQIKNKMNSDIQNYLMIKRT
jgi:hypothetical protein